MFGAVKLTKNADISKYIYSRYGIGFDEKGAFSHPSGEFGNNAIIFGKHMSSSVHVDNKKKRYSDFWWKPSTRITLTAEKLYSINFTASKTRFCLNLHYNDANSYSFVYGTGIYKFKGKRHAPVANPLCPGNISESFSKDNMKKTGLIGSVYDFSVDYNAIAVNGILNIHKYLMKKNAL